ncbi:MAG: aspartate--tRNA(Asn) ligase [Candidatus Pacearchaeota archaeon]|nr:aspartate--tRNA(Asn) ligase [Candidatus Pacearchaeota archaeon]
MKRTYIADLKAGVEVFLEGWIYEIRELAKLKFLVLRDMSGMVQCVVINPDLFAKISGLTLESVVSIKGKVKKANVKAEFALKDLEVEVLDLEVLNKAEALPIQVNEKEGKAGLDIRLDNRSLDVRKPEISAIFKIQSTIINSFREFFYEKEFIEIQPPGIIGTSTEGGTDLFEIKYFEKKAYLAQSPQLYKQLMAISLEKVFSTNTIWRAEKHDTTKHINEIRQMDIEVAFADDMDVMKYIEEVVQYIVKKVLERNKKELDILELDLKIPKAKYLTYVEAIEVLNKNGFKMNAGDDFEPEAERKLCDLFKDHIVFTYEWPIDMKPFYIWPKDSKNNISGGFDALYGGVEISSGGQRVHKADVLIKQLKDKKLKTKDFEWYVDAFRFGAPMHAGWSIGLERLTYAVCKLSNIREGTLFPRDRKRLTP